MNNIKPMAESLATAVTPLSPQNSLIIKHSTPQAASVSLPLFIHEERTSLAVETAEDDLSVLMAELAAEDKDFARLLSQSSKELAPLAETSEGGVTLTSLRLAVGLTQTQLAVLLGKKQSNISQYEAGLRTDMMRSTLNALCKALQCDMNTLDLAICNTEQISKQHLLTQESKKVTGIAKSRKVA
jgi:DNA-binding Xre family transcriptional regulator